MVRNHVGVERNFHARMALRRVLLGRARNIPRTCGIFCGLQIASVALVHGCQTSTYTMAPRFSMYPVDFDQSRNVRLAPILALSRLPETGAKALGRLKNAFKKAFKKSKGLFPFFELPAEIRLLIYKYVFEEESRQFWFLKRKRQARVPAILCVNRLIIREAASMYWCTGVFDLVVKAKYIDLFQRFIKNIRPRFLLLLCSNSNVAFRVAIPKSCFSYKPSLRLNLLGHYAITDHAETRTMRKWYFSSEVAKPKRLLECIPRERASRNPDMNRAWRDGLDLHLFAAREAVFETISARMEDLIRHKDMCGIGTTLDLYNTTLNHVGFSSNGFSNFLRTRIVMLQKL